MLYVELEKNRVAFRALAYVLAYTTQQFRKQVNLKVPQFHSSEFFQATCMSRLLRCYVQWRNQEEGNPGAPSWKN